MKPHAASPKFAAAHNVLILLLLYLFFALYSQLCSMYMRRCCIVNIAGNQLPDMLAMRL